MDVAFNEDLYRTKIGDELLNVNRREMKKWDENTKRNNNNNKKKFVPSMLPQIVRFLCAFGVKGKQYRFKLRIFMIKLLSKWLHWIDDRQS